MDHMGLLVAYLVFVAAIPACMMCTVLASSADDEVPRKDHPYVRLLLLSYGLFFASCVFFLVHYGFFAHDGMGSRRIRFLAVLSCIIANCTIFFILLLASTGFAISTAIMPSKRVYLGAVALVGGLNALLELHAETAIDLSSKLYGLQSTPGLTSLVVKMFMTCWFAFSIRGTYEVERDERRRNFYKVLGISYTVWLLHVPITVLVCFLLAPYVRYKVVVIIDLVALFLGHCWLSNLLLGRQTPLTAENTFSLRDDFDEFGYRESCGGGAELGFTGLRG